MDQNIDTKYVSFGECFQDRNKKVCTANTGFYVAPQQGATLLLAIQFTTANDHITRDPFTVTIEGSNATWSELLRGTSWSLIATLPSGLEIDPGRTTDGLLQCVHNNTIWYRNYRVLVTSVRDSTYCIQYSEVKLFGYGNPNKGKII